MTVKSRVILCPAIEATTVESTSTTSTRGRSTSTTSRRRTRRSAGTSTATTRTQLRTSSRGKSRVPALSSPNSLATFTTWHLPRQFQASITLHTRIWSLKRLTSISRRTWRAHSNRIINGSHPAKRKLGSSESSPRNKPKQLSHLASRPSEQQ